MSNLGMKHKSFFTWPLCLWSHLPFCLSAPQLLAIATSFLISGTISHITPWPQCLLVATTPLDSTHPSPLCRTLSDHSLFSYIEQVFLLFPLYFQIFHDLPYVDMGPSFTRFRAGTVPALFASYHQWVALGLVHGKFSINFDWMNKW